MASVGIGSAKVDTIVENPNVQAGSEVKGVIQLKGGKTDQKIDDIYLNVMTSYEKEVDDRKVQQNATIQKVKISINETIRAGKNEQLPFSFILEPFTPMTFDKVKIWIHTGLDIKMAIDPTDHDPINVEPHQYMAAVLVALKDMGFQLKKVKNEHSRYGRNLPFIQNFEFYPRGEFSGQLDELEVAFSVSDHGVELLLEIDRKARGLGGFLAEAMDMDESLVRYSLSVQELQQGSEYIQQKLRQVISQYS